MTAATPFPLILRLLLPAALLFTGCTHHAYYLSPFHANTESYHAIPLRSDSLPSASYVSGVFTGGGANEDWRDGVLSFTGSFYRAHNFSRFQAFYGADATLGSYRVAGYSGDKPGRGLDTALINSAAGHKFFGGYGISAGGNLVIPFGRGSELRVPGLSFTLRQEYGNYLSFRKSLPDSAANTIFRNSLVGVLAVSFEAAFKLSTGMIGYKLQLGGDIINGRSHYAGNDSTGYQMGFMSQCLSVTVQQVTSYAQLNLGNHVASFQLGVNYRLGKSGRSHKSMAGR